MLPPDLCSLCVTFSQVIHPFYVFQIASIILWSLDDYYYYAFCIALISAISIVTTLIETKKVCTKYIERTDRSLIKPDDYANAGNVSIQLSGKCLLRWKL